MSKVAMTLEDIKSLVTHASRNDTFPALTNVLFQWAEQANDELVRLQTALSNYKKASAFCEKHAPNSGTRGYCVVCAGQKLSAALSAISYACEEPNEYQVSSYDLLYDEDAVVEQVKRKLADTWNSAVETVANKMDSYGCGELDFEDKGEIVREFLKHDTPQQGCYPGCYYYSDSCFRKDCKKK